MATPIAHVLRPLTSVYWGIRARLPLERSFHVIVAPPVPANRGDEAMLVATLAEYARMGVGPIRIVQSGPEAFPDYVTRASSHWYSDGFVYFESERTRKEEWHLVSLVARARSVTFLGADVLDGTYGVTRPLQTMRLASAAASLGVPTRIAGFSVSERLAAPVAARFRELDARVLLCARDPRSFVRLKAIGASRVRQTADLAFLLEPSPLGEIPNHLGERASNAGVRIGISLHPGWARADVEGALDRLAAAITAACGTADVVLIPHHPGDHDVLAGLARRLPHATRIDRVLSASQTKRVAGVCNHVLTSRMHIAIAALGMGRPVSCFPSQGKFHGLIEHFGLEPGAICLEDSAAQPAESLAGWLRGRIAAGQDEQTRIGDRLPSVLSLARANLEPDPGT